MSDDEYCMDESESDQESIQDCVEEEFLTHSDLEAEMKSAISDVQAVFQVESGICRILLHKYKWNKASLLEKFYEHPDTNAFLIDAQVIPSKTEAVSEGDEECEICCSLDELSGLACNHRACGECWKAYLTNKIVEGGQSEIECMASDCKLLMDDEKILSYITDPAVIAAYRRLTVNSYVETNSLLKWCPGLDCGRAVKINHYESRLINCPCGTRFCFLCANDYHAPVNCRLLKLWLKRCSDDSETFNWINANTKDCPKCFTAIEKNGGCNFIRCQSCKYGFCWHCMGPHDHNMETHKCNSYDDSGDKDKKNESRESLKRYLFYYTRYVGHEKSLQLEAKLKNTVALKMEQMQNMKMSWAEVQYLKHAVSDLSECRRTLMYTYAFAFYLERDNNSALFEDNQNDLETATEQLSGFLERDLDEEDLAKLKQKVQDKCRYVEKRRKILLDHCSEGYEQDIWKFNENPAVPKAPEAKKAKTFAMFK